MELSADKCALSRMNKDSSTLRRFLPRSWGILIH